MNINFPINFIVIPLVTVMVTVIGSRWSRQGATSDWYKNLHKPNWTPKGSTIGEIWIFIYILTTLAVMWYWNVPAFSKLHYFVGAILIFNAILNAYWNKLFFVNRDVSKAYKEMQLLNLTTVLAAIIILFQAPVAAIAMIPYIVWVGIATKITQDILKNQKNPKKKNEKIS